MKTSTKVAIGVSVAAVATIASGAILSSKVLEKVGHYKKRKAVKGFVNDKLGGNHKILSIVDNLSDTDIDNLVGIANKVKDSKERISVYGDNLKDTTADMKHRLSEVVDRFM
ncbi:hypothetical protein ACWOEH_02150 [Enterococcus nangangensis]